MKVLSVVGTRPEFVMAFPVSRALATGHEEVLVHTGQHYDEEMSDVFFEELGIAQPTYSLDAAVDSTDFDPESIVGDVRGVLDREAPDVVVVYGDTSSALAGALAAADRPPLVSHVEAGLRSRNDSMPEEHNRIRIDHASDVLFPPTAGARENLRREGVAGRVRIVGDVLRDALELSRGPAAWRSSVVDDLGLRDGEFVLATVHRAENTDDRSRLRSILDGLAAAPRPVVFPAHPRTVGRLREYGLASRAESSLRLIEPVGYLDFVRLLESAERVVTDSGGVQKEAYFLGTPCVTVRTETEWPKTIEEGRNELVGADEATIRRALSDERGPLGRPTAMRERDVSERIVDTLEEVVADRGRRPASADVSVRHP